MRCHGDIGLQNMNIMLYLAEHKHRMRDAELRRDDLDIGTGAVEGAVRNLMGMRVGMAERRLA